MSAAISMSDPLFGLRVTERIEVYSEIKTQENSPTGTRTKSVKMWWPGLVTALKYEATTTAMILKMEVKYEPLPEYNLLAATESAMVSSNNRMKEVSTGAEYEWRPQEKGVTQDDALLLYNDDNEDASEEEYTPPSRTNIQSRRKTSSAQDGRRKLTAKEVQDREMNFLRNEVQCIKGVVAEHSTHLARIQHASSLRLLGPVPHTLSTNAMHSGSLQMQFLSYKLAQLALKNIPPTNNIPAAERGSVVTQYHQEILTEQTDCTLQQFDGIWKTVTNTFGNLARCPKDMDWETGFHPKLRIVFPDFISLARSLGPATESSARAEIIRQRKKRGTQSITSIRIFGCAYYNANNAEKPTIISVGESFPRQHLSSTSREYSVLRRLNSMYDTVNDAFYHGLCDVSLSAVDLRTTLETIQQPEDVNRFMETHAFALEWNHISRGECSLYPVQDLSKVLGTLRFTIPQVTFRGARILQEMESVLDSDSFRDLL